MMGVRCGGVAFNLPKDGRAAFLGTFFALQDQDGSSFTHYKAITVDVERTTGSGRVFVEARECAEGVETGHCNGYQRGFTATG